MAKDFIMSSEGNICTFTKIYRGRKFTGKAVCHPDDEPFRSDYTGMTIAEARANIKYLKFKKNCEIEPAMKSLWNVLTTLAHTKDVDTTSKSFIALQKEFDRLAHAYDELCCDIEDEDRYLKDYIQKKDDIHKRIANKAKCQ